MKSIIISQGDSNEKLEMTVQVTQKEFDKMEELRKKDPLAWEGKDFDLLKAAKKTLSEDSKTINKKAFNWKVFVLLIIGIIIVLSIVLYFNSKNHITESLHQEVTPLNEDLSLCKRYKLLNEDNIRKIYQKMISWDYYNFEDYTTYDKETFRDLVELFIVDDGFSKSIYNICKEHDYPGSYEDFREFCGYSSDFWENVLNRFIYIKNSKQNLTNEEWFKRFPEFNHDINLLQAAFDYEATVKSEKYNNKDVLKSKFPEFWPEKSVKTMTFKGVNFKYPQNWDFKKEVKSEGIYVIDGNNAKDAEYCVLFADFDHVSEDMWIDATLKRRIGDADKYNCKPICDKKYRDYNARFIEYTEIKNGVSYYTEIYVFKTKGHTIQIQKVANLKSYLSSDDFKIMEKTFDFKITN